MPQSVKAGLYLEIWYTHLLPNRNVYSNGTYVFLSIYSNCLTMKSMPKIPLWPLKYSDNFFTLTSITIKLTFLCRLTRSTEPWHPVQASSCPVLITNKQITTHCNKMMFDVAERTSSLTVTFPRIRSAKKTATKSTTIRYFDQMFHQSVSSKWQETLTAHVSQL
jgi:hypothetical protein